MREQQLDALLSDLRHIADARMADVVLTEEKKQQILDACLASPVAGIETAREQAKKKKPYAWVKYAAMAAAVVLCVAAGVRMAGGMAGPKPEAACEQAAPAEAPQAIEYTADSDEAAVKHTANPTGMLLQETMLEEGLDEPEAAQQIITDSSAAMMESAPTPAPAPDHQVAVTGNSGAEAPEETPPPDEEYEEEFDEAIELPPPDDEGVELPTPDGDDEVVIYVPGGGAIIENDATEDEVEEEAEEEVEDEAMDESAPDLNGAVAFVKAVPVAGSQHSFALSLKDGVTVTQWKNYYTGTHEDTDAMYEEDVIEDEDAPITPIHNAVADEEVMPDESDEELYYLSTVELTVTESLWGSVPVGSAITVLNLSVTSGTEYALVLAPIHNPTIDGVTMRLDLLADYSVIYCSLDTGEEAIQRMLTQLGGN